MQKSKNIKHHNLLKVVDQDRDGKGTENVKIHEMRPVF